MIKKGKECYRYFTAVGSNIRLIRYKYKSANKIIFVCIADDLNDAREKLHIFLKDHYYWRDPRVDGFRTINPPEKRKGDPRWDSGVI